MPVDRQLELAISLGSQHLLSAERLIGRLVSPTPRSTFTLTKKQKGKTIKVVVTGKKSGYSIVSRTSKSTRTVKK